eukprot:2313737-Alexandrium_andersonii.AAC.1
MLGPGPILTRVLSDRIGAGAYVSWVPGRRHAEDQREGICAVADWARAYWGSEWDYEFEGSPCRSMAALLANGGWLGCCQLVGPGWAAANSQRENATHIDNTRTNTTTQ